MVYRYIFLILIIIINECASCPCDNPILCERISKYNEKEVFVYKTDANIPITSYPLSVVTTIVLFTKPDYNTMCIAHQYGVRVILGTSFNVNQLNNETARDIWVNNLVESVGMNYLDGVNVDIEGPISDDESSKLLTSLMTELRYTFDDQLPNSQLSFAVAWSPNCIDGRCYDYAALGEIMDLLFVMAYDMQSQILPSRPCLGYSNSPLSWITQALNQYINILGISSTKLILGVPWYGYEYECINNSKYPCEIKQVPFRGVNCSDAAGSQWPYSKIMNFLNNNSSIHIEYDNVDQAPYFSYYTNTSWHIVRYDNVNSLTIKYNTAKAFQLRGVGCWNADLLDYSSKVQTTQMWDAMASFKS